MDDMQKLDPGSVKAPSKLKLIFLARICWQQMRSGLCEPCITLLNVGRRKLFPSKAITATADNNAFLPLYFRFLSNRSKSPAEPIEPVPEKLAMQQLAFKPLQTLTTRFNTIVGKKPERVLTSYQLFCQRTLANISQTHPNMPPKERFAYAAREWKALNESQRLQYGSDNSERINVLKRAVKMTRPTTAYRVYIAHALKELHAQQPETSPNANFAKATARWKNITSEAKQPFVVEAARLNETRRTFLADGMVFAKHPGPPTAAYIKAHAGDKPENLSQQNFIAELSKRYAALPDAEKTVYREAHKKAYEEYAKCTGKAKTERARVRPPSSWALYVGKQMANRPAQVSVPDYMKILGKQWTALSAADKLSYVEQAADLLKQYREWQLQRKNATNLTDPLGGYVSNTAPKPAKKRHQKPVFSFFVEEQMINRPAGSSSKQYVKQLGENWRTLSDTEKQKYKLMAVAYKNGQKVA